jgi:hypothetical protein
MALMMEEARSSETLVNFYQTTWRYNPEDSHLHTNCHDNLKSYLASSCLYYCTNLPNSQPILETNLKINTITRRANHQTRFPTCFITKILHINIHFNTVHLYVAGGKPTISSLCFSQFYNTCNTAC